jgi:hypothetical protein
VTLAIAAMLAISGFAPFLAAVQLERVPHNTSLWPLTLLLGAGLIVAVLVKREPRFAIAAGPFLTPYVMLTSWSAPLLAVVSTTPELAAAVAGTWVLAYLQTGLKAGARTSRGLLELWLVH